MVSTSRRPTVWAGSSPAQNTGPLSEGVIPAVPGEFYSYSSEFTEEKPLYVLMKCKANKARAIAMAEELGREANLVFQFNNSVQANIYSIKEASALGLLGKPVSELLFGETWIAPTGVTPKEFYNLRSQHTAYNAEFLAKVCWKACARHNTSLTLYPNAVVAMMTECGKYGLFFVKRLTTRSIQIDACHILL